jgi:DNA-binding MarR family transcriptional regulator
MGKVRPSSAHFSLGQFTAKSSRSPRHIAAGSDSMHKKQSPIRPGNDPERAAWMPTENVTEANESLDVITDALLTASRLLVGISARSIAQVDETITTAQFRTLVILSNRGPINLATLASLLGVQPSATGRMVDRLVASGLIDRLPHPTSRRELLAALTKRGRDVVRRVTAHRRAEIAAIVEKMPVADRHGLVRALTSFTAAGGEPDAALDVDV